MVVVEIKSTGQHFTIDSGRIVDGDMQFSPMVKMLAKTLSINPGDKDPDYLVAQELVALHGGKIVEHRPLQTLSVPVR